MKFTSILSLLLITLVCKTIVTIKMEKSSLPAHKKMNKVPARYLKVVKEDDFASEQKARKLGSNGHFCLLNIN